MTRLARAPGKLVLSGAYSVLWGAPAMVTAVSREAVADAARAPVHLADEVRAAIELGAIERACFVDVSALRASMPDGSTRKLGLGSSAAILVATMLALGEYTPASDPRTASELFAAALRAHRTAQGGGSGIDVAASTFGGTLRFALGPSPGGLPEVSRIDLPAGTFVEVLAASTSASTSGMVGAVRAFAARDPGGFEPLLARAKRGAERALDASSPRELAASLVEQEHALRELGDRAGVPIVPPALRPVAREAESLGAFFGPSGAGGGDIAFYLGGEPMPESVRTLAALAGLEPLSLRIDAPGARRDEPIATDPGALAP